MEKPVRHPEKKVGHAIVSSVGVAPMALEIMKLKDGP